MTSLHQRSVSATDRRSAYSIGGPSRVNSTRTKDYERSSARDNGSPVAFDSIGDPSEANSRFRHSDSRYTGTERRREKSTVVTTETVVTRRSPRRDAPNGDARRGGDASRQAESPGLPPRPKDTGIPPRLGSEFPSNFGSSLESSGVSDPSLFCTAGDESDGATALTECPQRSQSESAR